MGFLDKYYYAVARAAQTLYWEMLSSEGTSLDDGSHMQVTISEGAKYGSKHQQLYSRHALELQRPVPCYFPQLLLSTSSNYISNSDKYLSRHLMSIRNNRVLVSSSVISHGENSAHDGRKDRHRQSGDSLGGRFKTREGACVKATRMGIAIHWGEEKISQDLRDLCHIEPCYVFRKDFILNQHRHQITPRQEFH